MSRTILLTLLLLLGMTLVVRAQTTQAVHDHTAAVPTNLIDGAQHPELIPDSVAYRLYFVAVSEMPNPTDEQKTRQLAHLGKIGLEGDDLQSLVNTLANFKVQYTSLIARYNASAQAALRIGATPDLKTFLLQREQLVQTTRDHLNSVLTPVGLARLHIHIRSERKGMRVAKEEVR